jgi:hypothetical protein
VYRSCHLSFGFQRLAKNLRPIFVLADEKALILGAFAAQQRLQADGPGIVVRPVEPAQRAAAQIVPKAPAPV